MDGNVCYHSTPLQICHITTQLLAFAPQVFDTSQNFVHSYSVNLKKSAGCQLTITYEQIRELDGERTLIKASITVWCDRKERKKIHTSESSILKMLVLVFHNKNKTHQATCITCL